MQTPQKNIANKSETFELENRLHGSHNKNQSMMLSHQHLSPATMTRQQALNSVNKTMYG